MARILVFEDDMTSRTILVEYLTKANHEVQVMKDAGAVKECVDEFKPDLVITDIIMPGITGSGVHQIIRQEFGPNLPIIVSSSSRLHIKTSRDPLLAYCPKPIDVNCLLKAVQSLVSAKSGHSDPVKQ